MDDVESAILRAWSRVAPRFAADADDLRRRLRRRASLADPPRAWCLAVRASDTRLRPDPDDESPPRTPALPTAPLPLHDHITLHPSDLRTLCAPVSLPAPGETIDVVAARLGTTPNGLLHARVAGVFRTRYVRGLGGRGGKPRPLLYTPSGVQLDPSARLFRPPDPLWSWTTAWLIRMIDDAAAGDSADHDDNANDADDPNTGAIANTSTDHTAAGATFVVPPQTLARVRRRQVRAAHLYRDGTHLHPEHPANDSPPPGGGRRGKSLRLPPVPPWAGDEAAAYKWRDGAYVGHDWRNPAAAARALAARRRGELANAARQRRRREKGTARPAGGAPVKDADDRGLRWLCPACGRPVNVVYLPLPPFNLLVWAHGWRPLACDPLPFVRACPLGPWPRPGAPAGFACERCHRLRRSSRADPNCWNEIVRYLTGGLLYGREVERPAWLARARRAGRTKPRAAEAAAAAPSIGNGQSEIGNRKLPYTPRPNRAPSRRRPQIERLLLAGRTFRQIAADLGLAYGTVLWYAQRVYERHGVRTRPELLAKHGRPPPPPSKKEQVRQRLAAGQGVYWIAREMGISKMAVYNHVHVLRKAGVMPQRTTG